MKIELKNIHHIERMSEETACFTADLYIEGKKVGNASNTGKGGPTDYRSFSPEGQKLIEEAVAWCKKLPRQHYPATENHDAYSIGVDLESYIDDLFEKWMDQRLNKKLEKFFKQYIVVSEGSLSAYNGYKLREPVDSLLATPEGRKYLTEFISGIIPKLEKNEKIYNSNIPEGILKDAGLKENKYVKPAKDVTTGKRVSAKRNKRI